MSRSARRVGPLVALALAAGLTAPLQAQEPADTLHGTVTGTVVGRFQGEPRPLGFATIQARAPGFARSVATDSVGGYALRNLPAGPVQLQVTHPGHEDLTVEVVVPRGGSLTLDLELQGRPVQLPPVEVVRNPRVGEPNPREPDLDAVSRVETVALEAGAVVGMPGLVEAVQGIPGNDPANPTDVLFMRGSTTDLKLVLLDGAPVFTPFHVAGLLTSFEPSVLDRATLHVGGAPARYDGGLTYILDLGTRRPSRDRVRTSGALDLLSASLGLDAPLGRRGGVLVTGRTLHNLGDGTLGGVSPYGYSDVLGNLEVEPAAGHLLTGMGFWNRESVVLDYGAPAPGIAGDGAWWSNRAGGLTYHGDFGGFGAEVTVAASGYDAQLPLLPGETQDNPDPEPLLATAVTDRMRIVAELSRPSPSGTSRMGFSWETQEATYDARPLLEGGPSSSTWADAQAAGAFIDVTREIDPTVTVRLGLRADGLTGERGGLRLAPRGALTLRVGPQAYLTVAAGRYHQHAQATDVEVERTLSGVVTEGTDAAARLSVATADHVVVSLDQSFGGSTRLGLEGFWKGYTGLRGADDGPIRSSGLDIRLRSQGDRGTAWLGYGLSWYWSGQGLGGSSEFTGRHLLSAGLTGALTGPFQAAARISYGAGLPYSAIPFGSSDSASPLSEDPGDGTETLNETPPVVDGLDEAFLRLDLEVQAVLRPRWGDHQWEVRPYLRILNALDRRDALFYTFQPWRDEEVRPLAQRPLLPVLGVAWRF